MLEAGAVQFWGLVEVMGHQRYAGLVSEHLLAGCGFVRVDIPESPDGKQQAFSKLFGPKAIHSITPLDEQTARGIAFSMRKAPLEPWEASRALALIEEQEGAQFIEAEGEPEGDDGPADQAPFDDMPF